VPLDTGKSSRDGRRERGPWTELHWRDDLHAEGHRVTMRGSPHLNANAVPAKANDFSKKG